jgi:large subunit ribosomal protein L25
MSNAFELEAKVRTDLGKGASRRLRRLNKEIPAIIYGGDQDPLAITLQHDDISHAVENEAFFSHIITLKVGKDSVQAIIKDLQRHPAKPFIMHADFQRVLADEEITVEVPIHFLNEDNCPGVKLNGGSVIHAMTEVEITCLPRHLPEFLEIDMEQMEIGDSVHLSDIKFPEGVSSVSLSHGGEDDDLLVATVQPPRAVEEEPEAAAPAAPEAPPVGKKEGEESAED